MRKITSIGIILLLSLLTSHIKAEINFDLTSVGGTITLDYDAVNTEKSLAQADRWISVVNFGASGTASKCGTATKTFDIKSGRTITFYLAKCDKMTISANIALTRGLTYTINDGTSTTLAGTGACVDYEVNVNSESPVKIIVQGLNSSSAWTSFFTFAYAPKVPSINSFKINGTSALVDNTNKTITLEMPYGTNISSVIPDVTLGGTAISYSPTGAQDFSAGPVTYTITDGTTPVDYSANITVKATPDTNKAITSLSVNGKTATIDEATGAISCDFPSFAGPLSSWPVTFSLDAATATTNFTSGDSFDFATNSSLSITVTAQDNSTKVYTVTPSISTKKNVAILSANGKAESYDNLLLSAFNDYYVSFLNADAIAPIDINAFYANYDLIVIHANVSGTNPTGIATKAMVGIKPMLNLKAFFYNSGRWNWSTVAPGNAAAGVPSADVDVSLQSHPVFSNVTFNGTTLTYYDNLPATNTNAIQYASDLATIGSMTSHTLATVNTTGIQMHEIQDNMAAKYLLIGLSMESNNYTYFNNNAINVLKNAAAYLLNTNTKYNYTVTSLKNLNDNNSVYYSNGIIYNQEQKTIEVYNASGEKVLNSNEKTIETFLLSQGVYIVRTNDFKAYKFIK